MTFSMNEAAAARADAMGGARTLADGARVIDCDGFAAGVDFAEICMGTLGRVTIVPVAVGERTWPGVSVVVDDPATACLAAQYAGWKLEHEEFFALASGPGRALARAEELFDELAWTESAARAVLCLETRDDPPEAVVAKVRERCGVDDVTFLIAPTASPCGSVQISARVVETALHKLHELGVDPARVRSGWGCAPIAPIAKDDPAAIGRTNDAVLYGGTVHLRVEAEDDELAELAAKLPSSASDAAGTPFGEILEAADWNFYEIDPMLFSPAVVALTSSVSGRTFHAGTLDPAVLERSFDG